MKAIRTRYLGPTNFLGSRIKASANDVGSVTLSYDHALNSDENHRKAANELCLKMGWNLKTAGGVYGNDYYWVFTKGTK